MASIEYPPQPAPPPVTRAGWQCPGCLVSYSPDVLSCACRATGMPLTGTFPLSPSLAPFTPSFQITC